MDEKYILSELESKGFFIIKNYFSNEKCKEIINEMNIILKNNKDKVANTQSEGMGGDYRIYGTEKVSKNVNNYFNDPNLLKILRQYSNIPIISGTCLLGKLVKDKNIPLNSGGDWHRDSLIKQVKAICYLTDCSIKNGNFQFIPNSTVADLGDNYGRRINNEQLQEILKTKEIANITGNAGDVILVDTSNIHRGNIIEEGERMSLTTYYFKDEKEKQKFLPKVKNNCL